MASEEKVGYCKECGAVVSKKDEMLPDYPGCFECPKCGHPHALSELWDERPDYLEMYVSK